LVGLISRSFVAACELCAAPRSYKPTSIEDTFLSAYLRKKSPVLHDGRTLSLLYLFIVAVTLVVISNGINFNIACFINNINHPTCLTTLHSMLKH